MQVRLIKIPENLENPTTVKNFNSNSSDSNQPKKAMLEQYQTITK